MRHALTSCQTRDPRVDMAIRRHFLSGLLLGVMAPCFANHEGYFKDSTCDVINKCTSCYDPVPYCTQCSQPYYRLTGNGSKCDPGGKVSNCVGYETDVQGNLICNNCTENSVLFKRQNPKDNECIGCSSKVSNCLTCSVDTSGAVLCDSCQSGYALEKGKHKCHKCPDGCTSCHYDYSIDEVLCDICQTNRARSADMKTCRTCGNFCYNCTEISGNVKCLSCTSSSYTLRTDKAQCIDCGSIPNCVSCSETNGDNVADTCQACRSGATVKLDKSGCELCSTKHAKCVECQDTNSSNQNAEVCTKCDTGYTLALGGNDLGTCIQCPDQCKTCEDKNKNGTAFCTQCNSEYTVAMGGSDNGTCLACPSNCAVCEDKDSNAMTHCTTCHTGYTPSTNASNCVLCTSLDPYCTSCTVDTNDVPVTCNMCGPNSRVLSANQKMCTLCPTQCQNCTDDDSDGVPECASCSDGYGLINQSSQCLACDTSPGRRMDFCGKCSSSSNNNVIDRCSQCNIGFQVKADNTGCIECRDTMPGCQLCTSSAGSDTMDRCSQCQTGYALKADNTGCTACDKIYQCKSCTDMNSDNVPECMSCHAPYSLSDDKKSCNLDCSNIDPACTACRNPDLHCKTCSEGYIVSDDKFSCTRGCYQCDNSTHCSSLKSLGRIGMCNLEEDTHACWVHLTTIGSTKDVVRRECGNSTCPEGNDVLCRSVEKDGKTVQECSKCCTGHLCNTFDVAPSGSPVFGADMCLMAVVLLMASFVLHTVCKK